MKKTENKANCDHGQPTSTIKLSNKIFQKHRLLVVHSGSNKLQSTLDNKMVDKPNTTPKNSNSNHSAKPLSLKVGPGKVRTLLLMSTPLSRGHPKPIRPADGLQV